MRDERCEGFSKGMRQKVALAGALVHDPRVDHSRRAADRARCRLRAPGQERAARARRAGGTVIMTTHILEVAERMADRIGVIAHGRLIAEGTLEELRRQARRMADDAGAAGGGVHASLEDTFLALVAESAAAA